MQEDVEFDFFGELDELFDIVLFIEVDVIFDVFVEVLGDVGVDCVCVYCCELLELVFLEVGMYVEVVDGVCEDVMSDVVVKDFFVVLGQGWCVDWCCGGWGDDSEGRVVVS